MEQLLAPLEWSGIRTPAAGHDQLRDSSLACDTVGHTGGLDSSGGAALPVEVTEFRQKSAECCDRPPGVVSSSRTA